MIWKLILLQEWRFRWSGKFFLLFQFLSPAMQLAIYWFTSKALNPLPPEKGWGTLNFFDYVSLGEILILPAVAISTSVLRGVSLAHPLGILDDILLSSKKISVPLSGLGFGSLLTDLLTMMVTVLLYALLSDKSWSLASIAQIIALNIFVMPFFFSLSILGALLFLCFRRGTGIVSYLIMISSIAAGVYFPVEVLPSIFVKLLTWISPFTIALQAYRDVLIRGQMPAFSFYVWFALATGVLFLIIHLFLPVARQKYLSRRVSEVVINSV